MCSKYLCPSVPEGWRFITSQSCHFPSLHCTDYCCSVAKLCPTLCNPMDCRNHVSLSFTTPAVCSNYFPWVNYTLAISSSAAFFFAFNLTSIRVFSNRSALHISGQSIGVSASVSVLPVNIYGWLPLGLTGLISLQSKGLSRVFSSSTIRKHQFFGDQPFL